MSGSRPIAFDHTTSARHFMPGDARSAKGTNRMTTRANTRADRSTLFFMDAPLSEDELAGVERLRTAGRSTAFHAAHAHEPAKGRLPEPGLRFLARVVTQQVLELLIGLRRL